MTNIELLYDLYFNKLGWCGCGCPVDTLELVKAVLTNLRSEIGSDRTKHQNTLIGDHTAISYAFLYSLDNVGLIEHGGNIWYSWLTEYGEEIVEAFTQVNNLREVFQ